MRDTAARELLARIVGAVDKEEAAQRQLNQLARTDARRAMGPEALQAHHARVRSTEQARASARAQLAAALDEARKEVGS